MSDENQSKKADTMREEYTTNKVLAVFSLCFLGVLLVMRIQRRLEIASTFGMGRTMTRIWLGIGILVLLFGLYLRWLEHKRRRSAQYRLVCGNHMLLVGASMALAMLGIHWVGTPVVQLLYVLLPAIAIYYLIFQSYAPEFFVISLDVGVGAGLIWLAQRAAQTTNFGWIGKAAFGAMVFILLLHWLILLGLRKKNGAWRWGKKSGTLDWTSSTYQILSVTPLLMVLLIGATVFFSLYYWITLGIAAAYLFVTAVYYTVKQM